MRPIIGFTHTAEVSTRYTYYIGHPTWHRMTFASQSQRYVGGSVNEAEIDDLFTEMLKVDATLSPDDTTKVKAEKKADFQSFLATHCVQRQYMFSVKKCDQTKCIVCKPPCCHMRYFLPFTTCLTQFQMVTTISRLPMSMARKLQRKTFHRWRRRRVMGTKCHSTLANRRQKTLVSWLNAASAQNQDFSIASTSWKWKKSSGWKGWWKRRRRRRSAVCQREMSTSMWPSRPHLHEAQSCMQYHDWASLLLSWLRWYLYPLWGPLRCNCPRG